MRTFLLICYKSGASCAWKCDASSIIIMPVGGLIRRADSQAMQQQALDILNGPDIIALTFHFLYPFQKMKLWMRFLDGLELFKFWVPYHRPISTSVNARLSPGNTVEAKEQMWALFMLRPSNYAFIFRFGLNTHNWNCKDRLDGPASLMVTDMDKNIDRGIDEAYLAVETKYKWR